MLRDKFLVGRFFLPAIHGHLKLALKPIDKPDDIFIAIKVGVPRYPVDNVCGLDQYAVPLIPVVYR
jgi:hypothetical protein